MHCFGPIEMIKVNICLQCCINTHCLFSSYMCTTCYRFCSLLCHCYFRQWQKWKRSFFIWYLLKIFFFNIVNHSINQSIIHSIIHSINFSITQLINYLITQPLFNQSISHSINQSINQSIIQSINQSYSINQL